VKLNLGSLKADIGAGSNRDIVTSLRR
jgi:hypothetical protein